MTRLKTRLFEIFVSQKFIMFVTSMAYTAIFVPSPDQAGIAKVIVTVFGGMKGMDYLREAANTWSNGKNGKGNGGA